MLAEAVVAELRSRSDVACVAAESERAEDGLANHLLVRRKSLKSAAALIRLRPHSDHLRLRFRLPREYAEGRPHATGRNVSLKDVYQVELVRSLEHLPEALDLAAAAFENLAGD